MKDHCSDAADALLHITLTALSLCSFLPPLGNAQIVQLGENHCMVKLCGQNSAHIGELQWYLLMTSDTVVLWFDFQ